MHPSLSLYYICWYFMNNLAQGHSTLNVLNTPDTISAYVLNPGKKEVNWFHLESHFVDTELLCWLVLRHPHIPFQRCTLNNNSTIDRVFASRSGSSLNTISCTCFGLSALHNFNANQYIDFPITPYNFLNNHYLLLADKVRYKHYL